MVKPCFYYPNHFPFFCRDTSLEYTHVMAMTKVIIPVALCRRYIGCLRHSCPVFRGLKQAVRRRYNVSLAPVKCNVDCSSESKGGVEESLMELFKMILFIELSFQKPSCSNICMNNMRGSYLHRIWQTKQ